MRAIILAAGRGSRLKGFTEDQPKCFNKIGDKRLIDVQLNSLEQAGVDEIFIATGYKSELIKELGYNNVTNHRWAETNMVETLRYARELFDSELIISYSDIVFSKDVVSKLLNSENENLLIYDSAWLDLWKQRMDDPLSDAESFSLDENGYLSDIGRKVNSLSEINGQYIGLMKFTPQFFKELEKFANEIGQEKVDKLDMTSLIRNLIERGIKIKGVEIKGNWFEVDTVEDLELANSLKSKGELEFI